jgi:predicted ArsR family transcriptional regulator
VPPNDESDDESDEPPSLSEIDPFESDELSGDLPSNLGETVTAEWRESTTAFQRIHTVLKNTYEPHTTSEVADKAATTKPTVRKHVDPLVEAGMVVELHSGSATQYVWSGTQRRVNRVADLAGECSATELDAKIRQVKARVADFEAEYGVESPNELAERLAADDEVGWNDLSVWRTLEDDLKRLKAAQSMKEYLADTESVTAENDASNHA